MSLGLGLGLLRQGSGALNTDGLSLDLAFALDKTLTARKGPTPVFTRGSGATYVGPTGINVTHYYYDQTNSGSVSPTTLLNGRRTWEGFVGFLTSIYYNGSAWVLSVVDDGLRILAISAPTSAWRPDFADWSATSVSVTSTSTFGIVKTEPNEPRFDHDPSTGVCRGLLIEESRQNALLNSDALATQNVTVTAAARTLSFYGTGTVVLSGAHVATVVGTGAFPARTTLTFTPTAGTLTLTVTGTVQFAQLEIGAFPTSYIPTTTSALTRSADVCSITGGDFTSLWNPTEGTIFAGFTVYGSNSFGSVLTADPTFDFGKIQIGKSSLTVADLSIKDAANNVVFNYQPTSALNAGLNKSALAYKQNDTIGTINNLSSPLDGSVILGSQTQLLIGNDSIPPGRRINGAISTIRVFKKRLSLAKLQTLTTP